MSDNEPRPPQVINNPAKRLRLFLNECARQQDGWKKRQIIAAVCHCNEHDDTEVLEHLCEVRRLVRETRDAIRVAKPAEGYLASPFKKIEEAFRPTDLDAQWVNHKRLCDENVIGMLHVVERELDATDAEVDVPQHELDDFMLRVQRLSSTVANSSISPKFKRVFVDHLSAILFAIRNYQLRGNAGLREAMELNIGFMVSNHRLFQDIEEQSIVESFKDLLKTMLTWAAIVKDVKELVEAAAPVIGLMG